MTVRVIDRGYRAFMRKVGAAAKGRGVTVGVHGEAGAAGASGADGLTVADVATANEFGLGVPERSFVRRWFETHETDNVEILTRAGEAIVRRGMSVDAALERAGLAFVASMQDRIRGGIEPPNAEITIIRKGSSTPLIDTGQLVSSITFKVQ